MRFVKSHPFLRDGYNTAIVYPSPASLTYFWNFGIYAMVCLGIQILTGIFLAMYYVADIGLAFASVEHVMRDVTNGWLLRYIHANGASMFFIVVYIHLFRGLYYGSYIYPRQWLWVSGALILLLMIVTAFLGYVLPWGQMSFWGATVITNLFSAVPVIGSNIVVWLWGGYAIDNATLTRFFSLHYILPIVLTVVVVVHLALLHLVGSNNPLGVDFKGDSVPFYPYYIVKDLYGVICFFIFYALFVFFMPNYLGHSDNYIMANPLVTPAHIVPEWYFLPFYAILRSIPNKLLGVLALFGAILAIFLVPFIHRPIVRSMAFRPFSHYFFWFFVVVCMILGWIGNQPVKYPYVLIGQITTICYFAYFVIVLPFVTYLENYLLGLNLSQDDDDNQLELIGWIAAFCVYTVICYLHILLSKKL